QDQPPATNLLMQPTCEQCWSWCSYSFLGAAQEAPPERRLAIHGAGIVEIAVVSTTDSTSSYSSPQTTTSTTTTTTTTMTTSTTTLPPPPMVIADLPSAKEPLTTTTTSTATVETAIEQKKLTTMDPEQNILDPDYWYGEHHWDGDLSGQTTPTTTPLTTAAEELLTSAEYRGPPTLPGAAWTTISPLITFQPEAGLHCPDECKNGCPACSSECIGCNFCNPKAFGPFGQAAEFCPVDMQASAASQMLHWTEPPSRGAEQVGTMKMEVSCRAPCFEVWFSTA
ncbi:unnamed protein product, partial [Durusdinium trenchii]